MGNDYLEKYSIIFMIAIACPTWLNFLKKKNSYSNIAIKNTLWSDSLSLPLRQIFKSCLSQGSFLEL